MEKKIAWNKITHMSLLIPHQNMLHVQPNNPASLSLTPKHPLTWNTLSLSAHNLNTPSPLPNPLRRCS